MDKSKFYTQLLAGALTGTIFKNISVQLSRSYLPSYSDSGAIWPIGMFIGCLIGVTIVTILKSTDHSRNLKILATILISIAILIIARVLFMKHAGSSGGLEYFIPALTFIEFIYALIASLIIIGIITLIQKIIDSINTPWNNNK